ncbi:MAG TPA: DUF1264 domain-containing protein [Gemmataceae bacterium]|nr:DUF1264 domain-containing protein [Gemmataceae bacterium]
MQTRRRIRRLLGLAAVTTIVSIPAFWLTARPAPTKAAPKAPTGDVEHSKGPIGELMECPLAFAGIHLMRDDPSEARIAYHFCKPVSADLNQCILYDGRGPEARLIGIEYLVSDAVYQSMPDEEKVFWHDHTFEVDKQLLKSLTQSGAEEKKTLAHVRTMWGKVYHTWVDGKTYPRGPARLFWSVTGKQPFVLPEGTELPSEFGK